MKYIAYGSNMVKEQMAWRCPDARLIGMGYLEGARLEFYLHATVEHTDSTRDRVPVAVWEISERDETNLDRYEGVAGGYYGKEIWPVTMDDGSQIEGLIYIMKIIRHSPPVAGYYKSIRDAYSELGLRSKIRTVLEPALKRSMARDREW
ncbi:MAG: gamma-glutamylcyclotransferase [Clostridia bacterium]|nr:gamma-glutamylcyclotransferase [Clostridia bacterium]